jgi:hypothetical protein
VEIHKDNSEKPVAHCMMALPLLAKVKPATIKIEK